MGVKLRELLALPVNAQHADVRDAYQRAAKRLHPDSGGNHAGFVELQRAWECYNAGVHLDSNTPRHGFTEWGVGCSFSDSTAEREARMAVMDQASRGFMSAGVLRTPLSPKNTAPLPSAMLAMLVGAATLMATASLCRSWAELRALQPTLDSEEEWRAVMIHERRFQRALGFGHAHEGDDVEPL